MVVVAPLGMLAAAGRATGGRTRGSGEGRGMRNRRGPATRIVVAACIVAIAAVPAGTPRPVRASTVNLLFAAELVSPASPTTDHILLGFEGGLDPFSIPVPADDEFTLDFGSGSQHPTNISIPYELYGGALTIVRLDLATPTGTNGTFSYTPKLTPGSHPLASGGVPIDPIVNRVVDVQDPGVFILFAAVVDEGLGRNHALAIFSQPLKSGQPLDHPGDFVVTVTPSVGSPMAYPATHLESVEPFYGEGLLDITLPVSLESGDTATIAYTPTAAILDTSNNVAPPVGDGDILVIVNVAATSTHATDAGANVEVLPADRRSGTQPVQLTFDTVTSGGTTTLETSTTGPTAPVGFQLGDPPDYFNLSTTASFTGNVEVCVKYDETAYAPPESTMELLHYNGTSWVNITTILDVDANVVCGTTTSFSPFVLVTRPPFPFGGFFAPVDNPPTFNVLKAGAGVPVKFSLGGDRGLGILATGSPSSVGVPCPTVGTFDPVETTTTSPSGLHYDASSGQYTYAWKSDKAWAGTCRQFILRLVDGTSHTALFQFR